MVSEAGPAAAVPVDVAVSTRGQSRGNDIGSGTWAKPEGNKVDRIWPLESYLALAKALISLSISFLITPGESSLQWSVGGSGVIAKASRFQLPTGTFGAGLEFGRKGTGTYRHRDSEGLDSSPDCNIFIYCHFYCITKAKGLSPYPKEVGSLAVTKLDKMYDEYAILYTFSPTAYICSKSS